MSNDSKQSSSNAANTPGGVARRRKGASPQRPFVVSPKPAATSTPASALARGPLGAPRIAPKQPAPTPTPAAPPRWLAEPANGSLLHVTVYALSRYLRNSWFAVDAVLLIALFLIGYRSTFDTINFFSSAGFTLSTLSAVSAYGLMHGAVPPEKFLPLAREHGATRTVGGLALAAVIIRAVACLIFVGIALIFQRFFDLQVGPLLAGLLGLIVATAYLATLIVCLSSPIAGRTPRDVALVLLVLGFASFNATDALAYVLFLARIPLLPFIAPYRLGAAPNDVLAWLGTIFLAPAAIFGLVLLGGRWFSYTLVSEPTDATDSSLESAPAR